MYMYIHLSVIRPEKKNNNTQNSVCGTLLAEITSSNIDRANTHQLMQDSTTMTSMLASISDKLVQFPHPRHTALVTCAWANHTERIFPCSHNLSDCDNHYRQVNKTLLLVRIRKARMWNIAGICFRILKIDHQCSVYTYWVGRPELLKALPQNWRVTSKRHRAIKTPSTR